MQTFLSLLMLFLLRASIPLIGTILIGYVMNRISISAAGTRAV